MLGKIEAAVARLNDRPVLFDPSETARAGAFVSIAADGSLSVDRGFVRPEDEIASEEAGDEAGTEPNALPDREALVDEGTAPATRFTVITIGGNPAQEEEDDDTTSSRFRTG